MDAPSFRCGSAFWMVKYAPLKLAFMTVSKSTSLISLSGLSTTSPALMKRMSTLPKVSFVRSKRWSKSNLVMTHPTIQHP